MRGEKVSLMRVGRGSPGWQGNSRDGASRCTQPPAWIALLSVAQPAGQQIPPLILIIKLLLGHSRTPHSVGSLLYVWVVFALAVTPWLSLVSCQWWSQLSRCQGGSGRVVGLGQ